MKQLQTIAVDPIACDGHGLCAELFPERVSADDWGYPILDETPIPPGLERHAKRAVSQCPTRALRLTAAPRTAQRASLSN